MSNELKECRACASSIEYGFTKSRHAYHRCVRCGSVMTREINERCLVTENDQPEDRNQDFNNQTRWDRIVNNATIRINNVVDFGCGDGAMVRFLQGKVIAAEGIDKGTELQLDDMSLHSIDAFVMVEVIEHLYDPEGILLAMHSILKENGLIYMETGTIDSLPDKDAYRSSYCSPTIGHCSMFTVQGINRLSRKTGFDLQPINSTSFILHRI